MFTIFFLYAFHSYFHPANPPLWSQPITVQLVAFRIPLCTNLEMSHATLS